MSNQSIRELKRRKKKERKIQRRKNIIKFGLAAICIGAIGFQFRPKNDDEIKIGRFTEERAAKGNTGLVLNEDQRNFQANKQIATNIGFEDLDIEDKLKVTDSEYSNHMQDYVKSLKKQYCYQVPNDYSKTNITIENGDYLAYYGSENSFAKIKLNDTFYYVNRYGLSKLDAEKDIKVIKGIIYVDKDNLLPEDFNPGLDKTAQRAFETMLQDMRREGLNIKVASDFRSYSTEEKLFDANNIEAENPGTSEHQTGTAFDFFTENSQYSEDFSETEEYKWLLKNSYKYGFIERYPKDKISKTGHVCRPWHFRFVGVENAKEIYENDLTLEEYLNTK